MPTFPRWFLSQLIRFPQKTTASFAWWWLAGSSNRGQTPNDDSESFRVVTASLLLLSACTFCISARPLNISASAAVNTLNQISAAAQEIALGSSRHIVSSQASSSLRSSSCLRVFELLSGAVLLSVSYSQRRFFF